MKNSPKIKVIYRTSVSTKKAFALFPEIAFDSYGRACVARTSRGFVAAYPEAAMKRSMRATDEESARLREYINGEVGNVEEFTRCTPAMAMKRLKGRPSRSWLETRLAGWRGPPSRESHRSGARLA